MMVKKKKRKEENEDDEYVKSSNKSSTPLLLPRLANGRTSLCLLLWCWCFLVIIAFFFSFFNLTRMHFSKRWFVREMFVLFFPLSGSFGCWCLWTRTRTRGLDEQKKKNQHACIYFAGTNNVSHALHARKASVVIARVAVPVAP